MSLSRLNHWLPWGQADPEVLPGTAECHHQITDAVLPQPDAVFDDTTALDTAVDVLDPEPPLVERLVGQVVLQGQPRTAGFLRRHEDRYARERERQDAQILQHPTPGREWGGGGLRNAQIMPTAAVGVPEKEAEEQGIDQQDIFDRVIALLAAITRLLCHRVLGADDAPFRPVLGTRGTGSSASGTPTVAVSASATPRRWANAARERAGAAPRGRRAARSTESRTWIH